MDRRFEIHYSPTFTRQILENGGIKAKIKQWKRVTKSPMKAELKDNALMIYEVPKL